LRCKGEGEVEVSGGAVVLAGGDGVVGVGEIEDGLGHWVVE